MSARPRRWLLTLGRLLGPVAQSLAAVGAAGMFLPACPSPDWRGSWTPGTPAPGHPERLCPEIPLSAVELQLESQLRHLEDLLPREAR